MITLPAASAPPAVGVNTNVTLTLVLLIKRELSAREYELKLAAPPIPPDVNEFEGVASVLVDTVTGPPAVGVLPIDKPDSVMVTATLALRVEPAVVIMMDVSPGAPMGVRLEPAVEIEPVGAGLAAKKFDG